MATLYNQVSSNNRKAFFLIFFFLIFVIALGWIFSYVFEDVTILYIAVIFSSVMSFVSYYNSDKVVLGMVGAHEIQKKDSPEVILNQINRYKAENYPKKWGMIASGILFRKHNDPQVIKVMNTWWEELKYQSRRDQLSFNYACWKNNFKYDVCDLCYWGNEFFEYFQHK